MKALIDRNVILKQIIQETRATLSMEGLILSEDETRMLTDYNEGKVSGDDLRKSYPG